MEEELSVPDLCFTAYRSLLFLPITELMRAGIHYSFPSFQYQIVKQLIEMSSEHLLKQANVLRIKGPCIVVGDIHGSFHDLLRIFILNGLPCTMTYLFLGDYVDRGHFSTECMILLLTLMLKFPGHVFLLRGNHETSAISSVYGFKEELFSVYHEYSLWNSFVSLFQCLPLGAVLGGKILCVHGGISPQFCSLSQIEVIDRRCEPDELMTDILWSDPTTRVNDFFYSTRGSGFLYGERALVSFLAKNNLNGLIRAHQCVPNGVEVFAKSAGITVFSVSNYSDGVSNLSGVLCVDEETKIKCETYSPLPKITRQNARFLTCINKKQERTHSMEDSHNYSIIDFSRSMKKIPTSHHSRSFHPLMTKTILPFRTMSNGLAMQPAPPINTIWESK